MTTTIETPEVQATSAPRFSVTVQASELAQAVRNVAPFTSSDVTLSAITGIGAELSADGRLTLAATDRYALAVQVLNLAECVNCGHDVVPGGCAANVGKTWRCECNCGRNRSSFAGEGFAYLTADVVKALAGIKSKHDWELITLTAGSEGALTVALPDTRVMTWPSADAYGYPKWRGLVERFKPAADLVGHAGFNPEILARFAKVRGGNGSKPPRLVLTFGESNMSRFECGPVTGLICQWRDPS